MGGLMKIKLKKLLNGYEDVSEDMGGVVAVSKEKFFARRISGSFAANASALTPLEKTNILRRLWSAIAHSTARSIASFLASFGAVTMLLQLLVGFLGGRQAELVPVIVGASLALISVPLFFVDGALGAALQKNSFTDRLFFDFFGIKRIYRDVKRRGIPALFSVFSAAALATLGYFVPFLYVLASLVGAGLVYLSFNSPEFPLFSGLLVLPIMPIIPHGDKILAVLGAVMLISFLLKVASGKRALVIEQYDVIIILMMIAVLISGIFLGGESSFLGSLIIVGASLSYFVTSSAVTNRRLADSVLNSLFFSSFACAIVALVQFSKNAVAKGFLSAFVEGSAGTLSSRSELGAFLLVSIFAAFYFIKESRGIVRFSYFLLFLVDLASLVLCATVMSLIALLLGLVTLLFIRIKHFSGFFLLIILALPYALLLLDGISGASRALSLVFDTEPIALKALWESDLQIVLEHPFFGIGIGEESFFAAMSKISETPSYSAGNLFLGMATQAGMLVPILFGLMIAVRLRHRSKYGIYISDSSVGPLSDVTAAISIALLVIGTNDFLFASPMMFYLYMCVFGLGSAALRISREDYDNRTLYYRYLRRDDSAEIYVDLRRF